MLVKGSLEGVNRAAGHIPDVSRQMVEKSRPQDTHAVEPDSLMPLPMGPTSLHCWNDAAAASTDAVCTLQTKVWDKSFEDFPHVDAYISLSPPL